MKKICLIISLIGILLLLFIINTIESQTIEIPSINSSHLNKEVKIQGKITNIKNYENDFTTFYIENNYSKIQGICNCPTIKEKNFTEITGKITKYNNKLQIQVKKIKIIS